MGRPESAITDAPNGYLLLKRNLYERPNHMGYTGIKDNAGRYSREVALKHEDHYGLGHVVHESVAPDFTSACFEDLARNHLQAKLDEAKTALLTVNSQIQGAALAFKALKEENADLKAQVTDLEKKVYVPGVWRCAKCNFTLLQSNLNASNGTVTARDEPGAKCPNDGAPMWRTSWKDYATEQAEMAERVVMEKLAADKFTCRTCEDAQWVCESHMDKPWGGISSSATACKCGAGAPCPCCQWDMAIAGLRSELEHSTKWPENLTPELSDILSRPNFSFIGLSQLYRAGGINLKERAENEQAFFMHKMLSFWFSHGAGWKDAMQVEIDAVLDQIKTAEPQS